jgi:hypothetical protein
VAPSGQLKAGVRFYIVRFMPTDELRSYYNDLLDGSYDCVDRIVLNAHFGLAYSGGGFRTWWRRLHYGSDEELDNTHLMRMAGRFSRRVRGWARSNGVPVIDCSSEERKHKIAEEHLKKNPGVRGLFLILVGRAMATVWDVKRSSSGVLVNLEAKRAFINHYSFHILDPDWGHLTIKMAGHPPFGAQVILNGHEYVGCQARKAGISFTKEGNCFTIISKLADLARVADTLSEARTIGRLSQVCERWIYSSCLCFALDLEEQQFSGFHYQYSVYQAEYSRNLLFQVGGQMEQIFQGLIDRTRARLNIKRLKTIFGVKARPHRDRQDKAPRLEVVVETPQYDLTIFKLHFGKLTLKVYTKGERVLRFEAIVHNTKELGCGRLLDRFPQIVARLRQILEEFLSNLYCLDASFISDETLDQLPTPSQVGKTRVGGLDVNKPRMRAVLSAALSLACLPDGFTVGQLGDTVRSTLGATTSNYDARRAAYDLRKLRGKELVSRVDDSRRYRIPPQAIRTIAALVILREKVLRPILAGVGKPKMGRKPKNWSSIDEHYEAIRQHMFTLMEDLRIAA